MIIAGWILAILGLAQVVFAGTIEVSQLTEGNRLIGLAPSVVANVDLVGQRAMIHTGGCATFLAGVVFIGAAYLKPAPPGQQSKAWTGIAAIAALVLTVAAVGGFGAFLYARGRAAHEEATRIKGGFGGPPGSLDVGTELGFGVEDSSAARLSATRTKLWGLILLAVGLLWLAVGLLTALL